MIVHDQSLNRDPRAADLSVILHDLISNAGSLQNDQDVYEAVAEGISRLLTFERLSVVLVQGGTDHMPIVFLRGAPIDHSLVLLRTDPLLIRATTTRTAFLHNVGTDVDSPAEQERIRQGFQRVAVGPVLIDDRNFCSLNIASKDAHRFTESDLWIVETMSSTLGLLLAGSKLRKAAQARANEAELMLELGQLMLSTREPKQVLKHAAQRVGSAVNSDVLTMQLENGAWSADDPYVRNPSRLHSRRMLLGRITSLRPTVQGALPASGDPYVDSHWETRALDSLVSDIEQLLERDGIFRSVIVPLTPDKGGPVIVIALRSVRDFRKFSEVDRTTIERIMTFVMPAVINARLHESLARALDEREAVHRMSTAIGSGKNTEDRVRIACRTAQLLFVCDFVALTDWNVNPPVVRFSSGAVCSQPVALVRQGTITPLRRAGTVRIITDFPTEPPVNGEWYPLHVAEKLRASLTFKLQWASTFFGSLILGFRKPRFFSEADLRFAESLAQTIVGSLGAELRIPEHPSPSHRT